MRIFWFFLSACLLTLFFSETGYAQRIIGGASLGINLTQVDGDEYYGFHQAGINVGPSVYIPFGKKRKWAVGFELLFTQKGSYHKGSTDTTTYRLRLSYAEIPVLVTFTDKKIIAAGAGFSYGQLVGASETEFGKRTETSAQGPFTSGDISVLGQVQFRIYQRLWLDLRYQYSMVKIRTKEFVNTNTIPVQSWTRDQYNNVITVRLSYYFNQEKRVKMQEQK